jgi:hypothetical protein
VSSSNVRPRALVRLVAGLAAALLLAACSSSDDGPDAGAPDTSASAAPAATASGTTDDERPEGPAADLSEVIDGPGAPFIGESSALDPGGFSVPGYEQIELVAAGTASDYVEVGERSPDGRWELAPDTEAPYRTRVLVRRPADPADESGTVVVEWLNVSGGIDANPDWTSLSEEIVRQGHVWVGVSAQRIGVEGGPVLVRAPVAGNLAGEGLKGILPERYGSLDHPGDGYAFDITTQVARAVRAGAVSEGDAPDVVLAAGESQSAIALTTYINGVQPLTQAFDGFFVHSRAFASLPLVAPGEAADLAGSMATPEPVVLRDDLDVPVLVLQAEGDVVGVLRSVDARQPDSPTLRLWEVAGASHADAFLLGPVADELDCGAPINRAPFHLVAKAALRSLDAWARTGDAPPEAPRIEVEGIDGDGEPAIVRDADGIALGGIRLPVVDVPSEVLSGAPPPSPDLICLLMGSTQPLPDGRALELHGDADAYLEAYETAADAVIEAGFVLADDREVLLAEARPDQVR